MENSLEIPWKSIHRTSIRPRNPTLGHISGQNSSQERHMHPHVHCNTIHNSQDMETTQMSIDRWLDSEEVVYIHNGILLSHKKNDIMPFAATWMELETLILSEVSQKEKDKYHMISLLSGTFQQKRKSFSWRTDLWLPGGRGREWDGLGVWGKWLKTIAFGVD